MLDVYTANITLPMYLLLSEVCSLRTLSLQVWKLIINRSIHFMFCLDFTKSHCILPANERKRICIHALSSIVFKSKVVVICLMCFHVRLRIASYVFAFRNDSFYCAKHRHYEIRRTMFSFYTVFSFIKTKAGGFWAVGMYLKTAGHCMLSTLFIFVKDSLLRGKATEFLLFNFSLSLKRNLFYKPLISLTIHKNHQLLTCSYLY